MSRRRESLESDLSTEANRAEKFKALMGDFQARLKNAEVYMLRSRRAFIIDFSETTFTFNSLRRDIEQTAEKYNYLFTVVISREGQTEIKVVQHDRGQ